jgi:hypothetical protein
MTCISQRASVILFASISQYTGSIAYILLVVLSDHYPTLTQLCYTAVTAFTGIKFGSQKCLSEIFLGIWTVGVCKSTQLISSRHSHVIFSINTMVFIFYRFFYFKVYYY